MQITAFDLDVGIVSEHPAEVVGRVDTAIDRLEQALQAVETPDERAS